MLAGIREALQMSKPKSIETQKLDGLDISFYQFFHNSPLTDLAEELEKIVEQRPIFDLNEAME